MQATVVAVYVDIALATAKHACIFATHVAIAVVEGFIVAPHAAAAVVVASVCKTRSVVVLAAVVVAPAFRDTAANVVVVVVVVENLHLAAVVVVRQAPVLPLLHLVRKRVLLALLVMLFAAPHSVIDVY